jgi:hypothetical protein
MDEICKTLDLLIDRWCDRRAIGPLQTLLRVYPGYFGHTDQKFELLDAMKAVKSANRRDLTDDELDMLITAHNVLEDALKGWTAGPVKPHGD